MFKWLSYGAWLILQHLINETSTEHYFYFQNTVDTIIRLCDLFALQNLYKYKPSAKKKRFTSFVSCKLEILQVYDPIAELFFSKTVTEISSRMLSVFIFNNIQHRPEAVGWSCIFIKDGDT